MEYDVVVVGAGPSGLAAAIRLKQLAAAAATEIAVCVIEKGSEVGAHILSGAVFEPRALSELLPDWRERGAPLNTPASEDRFLYLTQNRALRLPTPPQMHNHGNYIISLGNLCRWLATQAEELGVEIYAGFAGAEVLYDEGGRVRGVATGDMGIGRDGEPTERYTPGVELVAKETLFAEGCRGSLTKTLVERFRLRDGATRRPTRSASRSCGRLPPTCTIPGGRPYDRVAARRRHLRRVVSLPSRRPAGFGRLCDRARLQEPVPHPVRGIPALQDASGDPPDIRGRAAHLRTVRGRSTKAAFSRSRASIFPAARWSAMRPAFSTCRRSRAAIPR